MAKYKFKWEDGKELEFDTITQNRVIHMEIGEVQGRYRNSVTIYVSDIDYEFYTSRYRVVHPKESTEKLRVGKLVRKVACLGFPAGTYVPYNYDRLSPKILLKGLTGELIQDEKI
jgi:hypothetical protein